jgi:hypothetical protein
VSESAIQTRAAAILGKIRTELRARKIRSLAKFGWVVCVGAFVTQLAFMLQEKFAHFGFEELRQVSRFVLTFFLIINNSVSVVIEGTLFALIIFDRESHAQGLFRILTGSNLRRDRFVLSVLKIVLGEPKQIFFHNVRFRANGAEGRFDFSLVIATEASDFHVVAVHLRFGHLEK